MAASELLAMKKFSIFIQNMSVRNELLNVLQAESEAIHHFWFAKMSLEYQFKFCINRHTATMQFICINSCQVFHSGLPSQRILTEKVTSYACVEQCLN